MSEPVKTSTKEVQKVSTKSEAKSPPKRVVAVYGQMRDPYSGTAYGFSPTDLVDNGWSAYQIATGKLSLV